MKNRAEKTPFIKPTVNIFHQVDFKNTNAKNLHDPESMIHNFGCCFMSHIAIPQFVNKRALTKGEIIKIYRSSMDNGWLGHQCNVKNPDSIINYTALLIGDEYRKYNNVMVIDYEHKDQWNVDAFSNTSSLPGPSNIYYCVVKFFTGSSPQYGGYHFQLFNGIGGLIYDPGKGTVKSHKRTAKISFYKVSNKK